MNADELLHDLALALDSPEGREDPSGMLAAWSALVRGDVTPDTRYWLVVPTDRERAALAIVAEDGHVTAGDLAKRCWVHPETARLCLAGMVERGLIRAEGRCKGRRYRL